MTKHTKLKVKELAKRALAAREWFMAQKPDDAPELPLTYAERECMKVKGLPYIVALFARSLNARKFRTEGHPNFREYASGVMASVLTPNFIRGDVQLLWRFPPVSLDGMGPGLMWRGG